MLNCNHETHALRYSLYLKLANDIFKCDSACVSWLQFSTYFNFCRFRALACTTFDKLSVVLFLFLIDMWMDLTTVQR